MSAAQDQSACQRFDRWLSAYVDAELDAVHCLEVEDHIEACEGCREHVAHLERTRASLKRVVKVAAPSSLRERLNRSLGEELSRDGADADAEPLSSREPQTGSVRPVAPPPPPGGLSQLRFVVPLAAAATIALVFGAMSLQQEQGSDAVASTTAAPTTAASASVANIDRVAFDLASLHLQPPPLETFDPRGIEEYSPHIGVRVSTPRLEGAQWVGGRLMSNAVLNRYMMRNRQSTSVFVFNPERVRMETEGLLQRRTVRGRPVFVGKPRGVPVAVYQDDGVGYALAIDSTREDAARLVLSSHR